MTMNKIHFYDKERKIIVLFNNFLFDRSMDEFVCVDFNVKINIDFFFVETVFRAELHDFKQLKDALRSIVDNKKKIARFNPLQSNIMLLFESKDYGHILVKCEIANDLYTCNINFEYMIDQSFLPELIREIDDVIQENDTL